MTTRQMLSCPTGILQASHLPKMAKLNDSMTDINNHPRCHFPETSEIPMYHDVYEYLYKPGSYLLDEDNEERFRFLRIVPS